MSSQGELRYLLSVYLTQGHVIFRLFLKIQINFSDSILWLFLAFYHRRSHLHRCISQYSFRSVLCHEDYCQKFHCKDIILVYTRFPVLWDIHFPNYHSSRCLLSCVCRVSLLIVYSLVLIQIKCTWVFIDNFVDFV